MIDQDVKIVEGIKLINLVIHDTRQGLSIWENARGPEVYGCLLYNNGWVAPDRYHGHNMYLQNRVGIARFVDNIAHNAFSHDIHAYGSKAAALDSLYFEGNAVFSAGDRAFLLGGGTVAHYATIVNNYIYNGDFNIGHYPYGKGADHCFILKNYLVGGRIQFQNVSLTEVTGNLVFMMRLEGLSQSEYPDNSWLSSRPGKNTIVVRPNRYERGRGHVVVFNWIGQAAVGVDLSAILKVGERFVVRDAQDYFGVSVTKGRYTGRPVEISMNSSSISAPIGSSPFHAVHTGNDFGVFVVEIREGHDSN